MDYAERSQEPGDREPATGRLRVVQLFVNSVDIESDTDLFDQPAVVSQWFIDKKLAVSTTVRTAADLTKVIELREALRGLLIANHRGTTADPADVATVESFGRSAEFGVTVLSDNGVGLVAAGSGLDAALGELLTIAVEASLSGQWRRLKVCTNDVCRWAYWDGSRNRSSRWCSMAVCGNQAKVRAHRERHNGLFGYEVG